MRCLSCFVARDKDAQGKKKTNNQSSPHHLKKVHVSNDMTLDDGSNSPPRETKPKGMYGYVLERQGHTLYSWRQSFLKLESGYLLVYTTGVAGSPCKMLPLHICMVRPLKRTGFRVICATQYSLTFRAKDVVEMREWVAEIQNGIAESLSAQSAPASCSGKNTLAKLREANPANKICADCCAPDPAWVSLSLGVLICIECSGVHRSLGTHISKVRSFELDHWDAKLDSKMDSIGNAQVNAALESNIPIIRVKPTSTSDRESRENWIIDKYVQKKFAKKEPARPSSPILTLVTPTSPTMRAPLPVTEEEMMSRGSSLQVPDMGKLAPGFARAQGVAYSRPRTPDTLPTSHIGSNVFAKKTPYGLNSANLSARRGSLGSFMNPSQANRATARRSSMFHNPRAM